MADLLEHYPQMLDNLRALHKTTRSKCRWVLQCVMLLYLVTQTSTGTQHPAHATARDMLLPLLNRCNCRSEWLESMLIMETYAVQTCECCCFCRPKVVGALPSLPPGSTDSIPAVRGGSASLDGPSPSMSASNSLADLGRAAIANSSARDLQHLTRLKLSVKVCEVLACCRKCICLAAQAQP